MTERITGEMIALFGKDVRRINHALKVYGFAACIARKEGLTGEALHMVEWAALLHDVGIKPAEEKYGSSAGSYQEKEGPAIARKILEELHVQEKLIERICHIIGKHHTYTAIDGPDFQILVEADFLVNIDEDHLPETSITSIRKKLFRTATGISILDSLYG